MTLTACGGGGGGSSGASGSNPFTAELGGITREAHSFGIRQLTVVPAETNFTLTWQNPANPAKDISSWTLNTTAYATGVSTASLPEATSSPISYTGNGESQNFTADNLTPGNYHTFVITATYADGNSSDPFALVKGRLLAGVDADGNGLADAQDTDDDGVIDSQDDFPQDSTQAGDKDNDDVDVLIDNCPMLSNSEQLDNDTDMVGDACDVDADGDGLIEIRNATALNAMRNNLRGTGLDLAADGDGDDNGCGGARAGDDGACNGYELMADVDLDDLGIDVSGSNWQPIGRCGEEAVCTTNAPLFSATFDGNHHTINNMKIMNSGILIGVGFFGAVTNSELRNIHLTNINISNSQSSSIGGLVGYGYGITVINSTVSGVQIIGDTAVGGLIGQATDAVRVISSSTVINNITSQGQMGGLIGLSTGATITSSNAITDNIISITSTNIGGLIGQATNAVRIISSNAIIGSITGPGDIGGFIGNKNGNFPIELTSSNNFLGKLVGLGGNIGGFSGSTVGGDSFNNSYSVAGSINSSIDSISGVNGFLFSSNAINIFNSYWDNGISYLEVSPNPDAHASAARSSVQLRTPTTFTDDYAEWGKAYCNPATGEYMESANELDAPFIRAWNLDDGDAANGADYPALNCLRDFTPAQQRLVAAAALAGRSPVAEYRLLRAAE